MVRFLYCLNLTYEILQYITVASILLNKIFDSIKYNIQITVNNSSYLNSITDVFFIIPYDNRYLLLYRISYLKFHYLRIF